MGILRMLAGELPLSPTQKRVRKERTGYGNDLDKFIRKSIRKARTKRVFRPDAPAFYGRINSKLKKGSIVISSNDLDGDLNARDYALVVLSSDGTPQGHNAEVRQVRKINPKSQRVTLRMPLQKEHGDHEMLGLYPFEDQLLLMSA